MVNEGNSVLSGFAPRRPKALRLMVGDDSQIELGE